MPPSLRTQHAGAGEADEIVAQLGPALKASLAPMAATMDSWRKQAADEKTIAEGTLGHLRGHPRMMVFLARGAILSRWRSARAWRAGTFMTGSAARAMELAHS